MWPQLVYNTLARCYCKVHYRLPTYVTSSTVLCYRRKRGLSDSRRKVPSQIENRVPFPYTVIRLLWFFVCVCAAIAYKYEAYGWRPNTHICTFSPTILYAREVAETDIRVAVQNRDCWQVIWTRDTASAASSLACLGSRSSWPFDAHGFSAGKRSMRYCTFSRSSATSNTRRNSRMSCPIFLPRRHKLAVEMKATGE